MGNAPSREPQGRSLNRLSRHRVASHQGTPPLLSPNGHLTTSNRSSDPGPDLFSIPYSTTATSTLSIDLDRNDPNDGEKRNSFLAPPKPQRRRSLFRSKSSQEPSERRRSRRNTVIGSPIPPPEPPAASRANSVAANNLGAGLDVQGGLASPDIYAAGRSRASWAYDLSSYEAQRLLSHVPEQLPALPRSNTLTSLHQPNLDGMRRSAWRRDSLPVQPTSAPMSRSVSEVSLHPPMRRRSMVQTPGIATRSVRPVPVTTRTTYRHSLPATPNMSRQASFEGIDYRVVSLPPLPPIPTPFRVTEDIPRVVTPTEGDYSTTGGFKFGTLRITNGDPDLTPDVQEHHRGQANDFKPLIASTDYFTELQPREGGETTDLEMRRTQPVGNPAARGKPEKSGLRANPEPLARLDAIAPTLSVDVPISKIEISTHLGLLPNSVETQRKAPASPVLVTQSKHTAAEDQLFEADDESETELHTAEVLDVRVDPSARRLPSQCQEAISQSGVQVIERSDSGFVSNAVSDSSKSHSSLTKADSGYSSSVSIRSFRSGRKPVANEDDTGRSPVGRAREAAMARMVEPRHVTERTSSVVNGDDSGDERAPTPPPKDPVVVKPVKSIAADNGLTDSDSKGKKAARQQLPPINVSRAEGCHTGKSESVPPTPASAKSDASESASSLSIGSTSQKHGRLHRFLSLRGSAHSRAPLTVHVTHAVDEQVPAIPKDVEKKLHEHTGRFPMSAKRLALKSQLSQETLKTILSVGSLEFSKEDELPPTPTFFDHSDESLGKADETAFRDAKDNSIRQTITSMQSNFKQAAASMMPHKKPTAAKVISASNADSATRPQETAAKTTPEDTAKFGQISASTSLRSHPYIAAEAGLDSQTQPRNRSGRSMTMMTPTQESRQPLRTYSLNTMPSDHSSPSSWPLSPTSPPSRASSPSKRLRSPPPVSMATRTSRRPPPPPPRSVPRPQFPEAPPGRGYESGRSPQSSSSAAPRAPALNAQRSLDSVRRAGSVPGTLQYRTSDWDPHTRQNAAGIQNPPLDLGRHSSLSAHHNDMSRAQTYVNSAAVRRQSSIDGFGRNRMQGHPYGPGYGASKPPSVHRRNLSTGSGPQHSHSTNNPPYRILHSYNSPAYRNAPIWG